MIAIVRRLLSLVAGERGWLVLVAVAAIGAWMYAHLERERAARAAVTATADAICAAAGVPFAATVERVPDRAGTLRTVRYAAGQRCRAAVSTAVAFRADTERATAAALAEAMRARDARNTADAQLAARDAKATRDAVTRMEIADAEAERRNRVGADWFAALNDLAGLRPAGR